MTILVNSYDKLCVGMTLIGLMLLLSTCLDPFSLKVESGDKLLVIDGLFSTSRQHLRLSYTKDLGNSRREYISDAQISLFDNIGNKSEYTPTGEGAYLLSNQDFQAEVGRGYHLEINLTNGKKYQTHPQIIPKSIKPEALSFKVEQEVRGNRSNIGIENSYINLYLDTKVKIDKETAYLRWLVDEVYSFQDEICHPLDNATNCYVYLNPKQELLILSGKDFEDEVIENIPVFSKKMVQKSPEYKQKHVFNIYQLSITKEAFAYWENVLQLTNQSGSIFDKSPAGLRGNCFNVDDENELVLGFFEVSVIETIRTFSRPVDFDGKYIFVNYCSNVFPSRFENDCCDCLLIEGSTLNAPEYW